MFEAYSLIRGYKLHLQIANLLMSFLCPLILITFLLLSSIYLLLLIHDFFKYFDCLILFWRFIDVTVKHCDKF